MSEIAREFVVALPKAELHLHLEGTLEPEHMFALARRNRVDIPFRSPEDVRAAYRFSRLQDFLDIYYAGASVLKEEEDFFELTLAYLERAASDGVRHVEVFFDPQTHTNRKIPFATAIEGILAGLSEGERRFGLTSGLILCFLRDRSEQEAMEIFEEAEPHFDRLLGVGLDSAELGNPPGKFAQVFEAAGAAGLKRVAHAGEEGPPDYVREALDILKVDRIDHGNRALEDPALTDRLIAEGVTLTVCPLSNLCLGVVKTLGEHPLKRMLELGLKVTVNSDDPAYFGGYVADNYLAVAKALGLSRDDLLTLARNSYSGAFLDEKAKARHLRDIDAFAATP